MSTVAWFLYSPSKKLVFLPVASALTGAHRNCLVLASNAQQPEIQPLMLQGQIVSADPLLYWRTDTIILITIIANWEFLLQFANVNFYSMVQGWPVQLLSPVYTRYLNCFRSQLNLLSWLRVNVLNSFTNCCLNRFVNHVWEVVWNWFQTGLGYTAIQTVHVYML